MNYKNMNFLNQKGEMIPRTFQQRKFFYVLIGIVIIILFLVLTIRTFVDASPPNNPQAYNPLTLQPKPSNNLLNRIAQFVFNKNNSIKGAKNDRTNILLLGMGGPGHDGPYLSDTTMILSIKPSTKQIALISIPRDLIVKVPGHGWQKINAADAYGEAEHPGKGPATATQVIEQTFGVPIQYYFRIDFQAFVDVVNDAGGITVDVHRPFTDTEYPAMNSTTQTIQFAAGVQTMNGTRALEFARSRHGNNGEGSDFARAHRQQQMLLALKQKVLSFQTLFNPLEINKILQTLAAHITTNMQFGDIMGFLRMAKDLDTKHIITLVLDDSPNGYLVDGTSPDKSFILEPKTGDFTAISSAIKNIFMQPTKNAIITNFPPIHTISSTQHQTIEILNGTWQAGLASRVKKELTDDAFHVGKIGNTPKRPVSHSAIYQITQYPTSDIVQELKQTLHIQTKQTVPISIKIASSTNILIILGKDFYPTSSTPK